MAIAYNAGTNIITITGYTEAVPCNFTDIYNADVAGGWGVVTMQCTDQFCFNTNLLIGDGSTATWFADTKKHITFVAAAAATPWVWTIRVQVNAHFRLGTLSNAADKTTTDGCSIILSVGDWGNIMGYYPPSSPTGLIELYSLQLIGDTTRNTEVIGFYGAKIYNCLFTKSELNRVYDSDIYNVVLQNSEYGFSLITGTMDKVMISDASKYAVHFNPSGLSADVIMKNIVARGCTKFVEAQGTGSYDLYLVNADTDNWFFAYVSCVRVIYRQYEFDLEVTDKDGVAINTATVKVWDKDSNLVVDTTTDASGNIAMQTVTRGYYHQSNGDVMHDLSPHLIKIEKPGYTTYEADFIIGAKTDWLIALQVTSRLVRNPPLTGGMV